MKQSRDTTGSKGRSIFRKKGARVLLSLAGVFAALAGIFPVTRHYTGSIDGIWRDTKLEPPSEYGLDYVPVAFGTSDGLNIQGWIMETTEDAPVVIFLHGFGDNRASSPSKVFGIAGALIQKGYNVLMFDFRGQGLSQGNRISAGLYETDDVLSAIKYLRQRGNTGAVGIMGFSMGAATGLIAAGESDQIKGVAADSSFSDVLTVAKSHFERRSIPDFLISPGMFLVKCLYGVDFSLVSPLNALKRVQSPVFLIHGGQDSTVPVDEAFQLSDVLQNSESRLWIVPEAEHTDAYFSRPKEYTTRLLSFFSNVFAGGPVVSPAPAVQVAPG